MNKQCYRVIFSEVQQAFVVVSELAKMQGKSKSAVNNKEKQTSNLPKLTACVSFLSLCCVLALLSLSPQALADRLMIQSDPSAQGHQRAVVLETANGIPQVNIQTPNDKGLSYNRYRQFDVDTQGALNNSHKTDQSQLAGLVQGNPYLATGEAKTIVHEVNANKPSELKGYLEVVGQKADVIIANPSGLYCEGCGVINAAKTTFTTGKTQIHNGQVEGFVVQQGLIPSSFLARYAF